METRPLTKADYDRVVRVMDDWWGGPTTALAHPIFFYELGRLARVVEDDGEMVGFLLGFVATESADDDPHRDDDGPIGYVHIVGIHPDYRRRGVARLLYTAFENDCRAAGCTALKAISTLGNDGSVRFHEALAWDVAEVQDYAGPARARLVFRKKL